LEGLIETNILYWTGTVDERCRLNFVPFFSEAVNGLDTTEATSRALSGLWRVILLWAPFCSSAQQFAGFEEERVRPPPVRRID
jgi:hypothetical protein